MQPHVSSVHQSDLKSKMDANALHGVRFPHFSHLFPQLMPGRDASPAF